jgi:hypothetical protein
MEHEGEPHAQVGGDARRHGQHHGVDRGPRRRWTRVPVLRRASGGVQAVERGHAHDAQAVVVVPAVRDHLGGLTSGEARGGLVRDPLWQQPSRSSPGRPPAATMTPRQPARWPPPRGSRRAHPAFGPAGGLPPSGSARGAAWRWPLPQRLDPSTRSSTRVASRWRPPQSHYLALSRSPRLELPCAGSARRPADQARPGSALRAGSLPSAGTITVSAPPSTPILASTIR